MPEKFDLCPSGDYDFFLGSSTFQIGCFSWYDDDLLDGIAAAAACHLLGNRSLDHMRRQIVGRRSTVIDHDLPAKAALSELEQHFVNSFSSMKPRDPSLWMEMIFDQAMVRVLTTLKNVLYLGRRGYVYETALVARGALEQIAWARGASRVECQDDVVNVNIHRQIGRMKEIYPSTGLIYGTLSKYSHFSADTHSLFYSELNGEIAVRQADRGTKFISMHWIFHLCDLCLIIFEEMYLKKLSELKGLTKSGMLRRKRFPMKYYKAYFADADKLDLQSLFS